ncbi:STAS/SEC14 domain-containing protein [Croceicoccus marinus]|uniref:STAS/SEC14 domain-containing protein n=1 Tax=Croceicoccus marinus TaxID=450378 RepID=A0A217EZ08_9SPHN|nr:STAS/SEC14 domain-containing protein [Croceicoccus marinus]ARU18372.1 hypothetical protein A9D14_18680 [Croceicoccus marinus]
MINIEPLGPAASAVTITDTVESADMTKLVDFARDIAARDGKSDLLFDINQVRGLDAGAIGKELAHLPTMIAMLRKLDRIAVVADEDWLRTGARLESALLPGVVYEVFDRDRADRARRWITRQSDDPHVDSIRLVDVPASGVIAFELDGRITGENARKVIKQASEALESSGATRMMARIRRWDGFDMDALAKAGVLETKISLAKKIERYAIVGGPEWIGSMGKVFAPLTGLEMRQFEHDDEDKALRWLSE